MDLGRFETHPIWNVTAGLILTGVSIWFLTRLDEEASRNVEARRHLWETTSTYEKEFVKYRKRVRLFYVVCTVIFFIGVLVSAIPLFR